jgi:REP element-mobilizing transposase RayT
MHSFTSCLVHCVWSTKNREPYLTPDLRDRLWPYLGGIAKQNHMKTLAIGGAADHVHVLLSLPATISAAKAIERKLIQMDSGNISENAFFCLAGGLWRIQRWRFRRRRYRDVHS